jgi:hypothetical protein
MLKFESAALVSLILSFINTGHAHYVSLEREDDGFARACFGE